MVTTFIKTSSEAFGTLKLELVGTNLSQLDESCFNLNSTYLIETTDDKSHKITTHDWFLNTKKDCPNTSVLSLAISMEVESNNKEESLWEAGLKLNDLNIIMPYFMIEDFLCNVHLCHVNNIDITWEESFEI